jgi:hypothetical protein
LKELRLDDASEMSDAGLAELWKLQKLNSLSLSGRFTGRGLESLKRLKSLTSIQLTSPHVTNKDVQALETALPSLQSVDFYEHGTDADGVPFNVSDSQTDTFRREGTEEQRTRLDALEGESAPELTVAGWINAGEEGVPNEQLKGKVVLVHFWSTKHPSSVAALARLYAKYHKDGLVIIGIHGANEAAAVPDFVAKQQLSWPVAADIENVTSDAWHATSYPSYYLINQSAKLRMARIYHGDLEPAIKKLLDEK